MKKRIHADVIADELRQGSVFFAQAREQAEESPLPDPPPEEQAMAKLAGPSVEQPTDSPTSRPLGQSTGPSTDRPTGRMFDHSVILGRPKAFYITEQQDKDLDVAVDKLTAKLQGRGNQKIDRSTVVRLLLEVNDITTDQTVDRLANQLVSRLVSQLTS